MMLTVPLEKPVMASDCIWAYLYPARIPRNAPRPLNHAAVLPGVAEPGPFERASKGICSGGRDGLGSAAARCPMPVIDIIPACSSCFLRGPAADSEQWPLRP